MKRDRIKTELLALGVAVGRWSPLVGGGRAAVETIGRAINRIQYLETRVKTLEEKAAKASPPRRTKR